MSLFQNRRVFIKESIGLMVAGSCSLGFMEKKKDLLLSFSTLGCPDWSYDKVIRFAIENNYSGIEIRGIQRELNLTRANSFNSPENIRASKKMARDAGIRIVNLGASSAMHHPPGTERNKNIDDAKQFIDLAHSLECPYIRVFPNNFPKNQDKQATLDLMVQGFNALGDYAKGSGVMILMETHGDLVLSSDILQVMRQVNPKQTGLVWDIVNMWSVTKEPIAEVYPKLKPFIHHTHIKDYKMADGKMVYTLMGKGESPIFQAIEILQKNKYKGFYSFEWEKLWHPEIEEPELALSDYITEMKKVN